MDELKVVILSCIRFRRGQVIIRGDSTDIINNFKHLSQSVALSSDLQRGPLQFTDYIRYARISVVVVHNKSRGPSLDHFKFINVS